MQKAGLHSSAVLQALLVTLLWSSSWVLIHIGLEDIPALTFAGLRYSLAFLFLLPAFLQSKGIESARRLPRRSWFHLLALGVLFYAVNQGAIFMGLALIPVVSASLILNLTPIAVAFLGSGLLAEQLSTWGWAGVALSILGALIYHYPLALTEKTLSGYAILTIGMLANAFSAVLGRGSTAAVNCLPLLSPRSPGGWGQPCCCSRELSPRVFRRSLSGAGRSSSG